MEGRSPPGKEYTPSQGGVAIMGNGIVSPRL